MDALERKGSVREHLNEKDDLSKKKKNQLGDIHLLGIPLVQEQEDSEGDLLKDADKHLVQKFKTYELTLKDVQSILMNWDRKQGILLHHTGGEDTPHEPDDQRQAPSGGRRGRKDRERERAEKERAEKERQEREKAERERLEKLRALEDRSDRGEVEGGEEDHHEGKKDLGVPFITIQTPDFEGLSWKQAMENDMLPKGDQVQTLLQAGDVMNQVVGTVLMAIKVFLSAPPISINLRGPLGYETTVAKRTFFWLVKIHRNFHRSK